MSAKHIVKKKDTLTEAGLARVMLILWGWLAAIGVLLWQVWMQ